MGSDPEVGIRAWEPRDREAVEGLLKLLSGDAVVVSDDAPRTWPSPARRSSAW